MDGGEELTGTIIKLCISPPTNHRDHHTTIDVCASVSIIYGEVIIWATSTFLIMAIGP
jgi:hypothetical protein